MNIKSIVLGLLLLVHFSLPVYAAEEGLNTPEDANKALLQLHSEMPEGNLSADAEEAIISLYGGKVWEDPSLAQYFEVDPTGKTPGITTVNVSPIFAQRFREDGTDKLWVLAYLSPGPLEDYETHVNYLVYGGAIFKKKNSKWEVESSAKIMGQINGLMRGRFYVIPLSPTKYGVVKHAGDSHYGIEDNLIELLLPWHGELVSALSVGYDEAPGPVSCDNPHDLPPQGIRIKLVKGSGKSGYFDVIVNMNYNEGGCQYPTLHHETKRYRFENGKYVLVR